MSQADPLVQVLEFKRLILEQLPVVGTLLAGVAMSGAGWIISSAERTRLRSALVFAFAASTIIFISTTILSAMLIAPMRFAAQGHTPQHIQGLITLSRVAVWLCLLGIFGLFAGVSGIGFIFTRKIGLLVASFVAANLILLVALSIYLDHVMRI